MGRPRRNRNDSDSAGVGAEDEQDKAQGSTHYENGGGKDEIATAGSASCRGDSCGEQAQEQGNRPSIIGCTDHNDHSAGSSSSDPRTQNSSSMSSLMDHFGIPNQYDFNQFQAPTDMPDLDQMADFDFYNGPSPSISPCSVTPTSSLTSHWMRPQAASVLEAVPMREQLDTRRPVPPAPQAKSLSESSANTLTDESMGLIRGLEERPFFSLETTFDIEQTHAHVNSGQQAPTAVGKPGENGAARSQSATCECYEIILNKLSDIDENQSDVLSSTIDVALMLKQCTQVHVTKVLECGICVTKRPTLLLLIAIIFDNVVCMLENASRFGHSKSLVENNNGNPSFNTQNPPTAHSSFRTPQVADTAGAGKSAASSFTTTVADKPPLLVGTHEILSEEKNKFLKQLLQGHLSSLSATLRQLMQYMQRTSPQNLNSRHGTITVVETHKRLQSIIGRVELWDGNFMNW